MWKIKNENRMRASLLESDQEKFYISLNLMYFALQLIVFRWKQIHLSFIVIKIRFYSTLRSASMIEIYFSWYVDNVKLFLSQKSYFDLVEKIRIKIARAHNFLNLQRTGNNFFLFGQKRTLTKDISVCQIYWHRKQMIRLGIDIKNIILRLIFRFGFPTPTPLLIWTPPFIRFSNSPSPTTKTSVY